MTSGILASPGNIVIVYSAAGARGSSGILRPIIVSHDYWASHTCIKVKR